MNLAQLAYAGFFTQLGDIPAVIRWIQYLAPLKFALEALAVNEVSSGIEIVDVLQGVKVSLLSFRRCTLEAADIEFIDFLDPNQRVSHHEGPLWL